MLTLLSPTALLALLGLLVPVAIHLWNRRPGREVPVGSLRWLVAGANRRLRNLKLEQLWLLLLRAVLLGVLAVALAGPAWQQKQPAPRGQVLLDPELLGAPALAAVRPRIDSLRRAGYALRLLAPAWPLVPAKAWADIAMANATASADSLRRMYGQPAAYHWARVQQAAGAFPGQPLAVFTSGALRNFQGTHPGLPANVSWQTLPVSVPKTWLQAASGQADSLRVVVGRSTETLTTFKTIAAARPRPGDVLQVAGLVPQRVQNAPNGQLRLVPAAATVQPGADSVGVPVAEPLRIVVYATAEYAYDAKCLLAALRAVVASQAVPMELSVSRSVPAPLEKADWVFWLTDAPVSAAWQAAVQRGTRLWQAAQGPGIASPAQLVALENEAPLTVFRRSNSATRRSAASPNLPVWVDAQGRAVLSQRVSGSGAYLQLNTRFHPSWSELAESPELPARLLALLRPEAVVGPAVLSLSAPETANSYDQRAIDPSQVSGSNTSQATFAAVAPTTYRTTELRPWLVLLAALLFAWERVLAWRRSTTVLPSNL